MHQRFDVGDMRQGENGAAIDLLIMRHIAGNHRKAHIHLAKKCLDLQHLGDLPGLGDKFVKGPRVGLVQSKAQRDLYRIAKSAPVDHRTLAEKNTRLAQLVQPPRQARWRETEAFRQIRNRLFRVALHVTQYAPIQII